MKLLAWGRLLRLSLAPSAAADVLCGLTLAAGGALPLQRSTLLLVAASLCVYHGGMALNDWADREHDRATRPGRPIPSGAVRPPSALLAALLLFAAGPLLAWAASPGAGAWTAGVALLAVLYDLGPRGSVLGPLLLALCRAGNLGLGFAFAADAHARPLGLAFGGVYGAYVFLASRLGRLEDRPEGAPLGRSPARLLGGAGAFLLVVPTLPLWVPRWEEPRPWAWSGAVLLVAWAVGGIARCAQGDQAWTGPRVEAAMGLLLRRLLIFTAAGCLLAPAGGVPWSWRAGPAVGLAILAGYPLAHALRRAFPPS